MLGKIPTSDINAQAILFKSPSVTIKDSDFQFSQKATYGYINKCDEYITQIYAKMHAALDMNCLKLKQVLPDTGLIK